MKIIMMVAADIGGIIAENSSHYTDWTSAEDKKLFVKTTMENQVVIMGDNTYFTLKNRPLKGRLNVVFTYVDLPETPSVKWVNGDPKKVVVELENEGHSSAVLIGGSIINSLFLKHKLIDEIWLTVEPKIFGTGISVFSDKNLQQINLELFKNKTLNKNTILLCYKVKK